MLLFQRPDMNPKLVHAHGNFVAHFLGIVAKQPLPHPGEVPFTRLKHRAQIAAFKRLAEFGKIRHGTEIGRASCRERV